MGGCAMSASAADGVIDARNRVFNYHNLYVVDGSMLAANLGVNPSLTITALAERAMSFIPRLLPQQDPLAKPAPQAAQHADEDSKEPSKQPGFYPQTDIRLGR